MTANQPAHTFTPLQELYPYKIECKDGIHIVTREGQAPLYTVNPFACECRRSIETDLFAALESLLLCLHQHERLGHIESDPRWEAARAALARAQGISK